MITYKRGKIEEAIETHIVHGCNCVGVWGAGVAKALRSAFPEAHEADRALSGVITPLERLGTHTSCAVRGKVIHNAYTQLRYGSGHRDLDYNALIDSIVGICKTLEKGTPVAVPRIGAGLGGGDWDIIWPILNAISNKYQIPFVVYIPKREDTLLGL